MNIIIKIKLLVRENSKQNAHKRTKKKIMKLLFLSSSHSQLTFKPYFLSFVFYYHYFFKTCFLFSNSFFNCFVI